MIPSILHAERRSLPSTNSEYLIPIEPKLNLSEVREKRVINTSLLLVEF